MSYDAPNSEYYTGYQSNGVNAPDRPNPPMTAGQKASTSGTVAFGVSFWPAVIGGLIIGGPVGAILTTLTLISVSAVTGIITYNLVEDDTGGRL